ncbi:MAG: hypothetical protein HYR80_05835 [Nitrospirae bacterium]|nr:hypothetical protein [Nitrospirota bacterium]
MIILDRPILETVLAVDPEAVSRGLPMWSCFDSHQVVRPLYETVDEFRTGTGYHPQEDLMGCEAPFCVYKQGDWRPF